MADFGNIEVDGFVKQREALESLMMSNPEMEKRAQKLIRQVLMIARKQISNQAKGDIKADPRQAYKAVKTAVYKRILGGSVSILNKRKAGPKTLYEPPRTLKAGQRGGNRRIRSMRTEQVMSYQGADRGFILRFINAGTDRRQTKYGNRGSIVPRNFFSNSSHTAMQKAAEQLGTLIDEMIKKELG